MTLLTEALRGTEGAKDHGDGDRRHGLEIPKMIQSCWSVGTNGDDPQQFQHRHSWFQRWSCRREWATVYRMNHDQTADSVEGELKKIQRVGRGRRDLILVAALIVVGS